MCLEGWGTYLLSQDKPAEAAQLLARALKVSKEVLGEDHEQVWIGRAGNNIGIIKPLFQSGSNCPSKVTTSKGDLTFCAKICGECKGAA